MTIKGGTVLRGEHPHRNRHARAQLARYASREMTDGSSIRRSDFAHTYEQIVPWVLSRSHPVRVLALSTRIRVLGLSAPPPPRAAELPRPTHQRGERGEQGQRAGRQLAL
eukprot:6175376-Pleurochrysis_carterae.AAC.4